MRASIFLNIKELFGVTHPKSPLRGSQLAVLPSIKNAYLIVEGNLITDFGPMDELTSKGALPSHQIDVSGKMIFPCWCDSHTHLVFPHSRESEFIDKIKGMSYAEIAARGGGILNSAQALQQLSEDQLFADAYKRLGEIAQMGTGSVEIKSGYGLNLESELKMLRVIRRLKNHSRLRIRSTFLGAHAFPLEYRENREEYVRIVIDEMIPAIAAEKLADFIDVFCEEQFFTREQTEMICRKGMQHGMLPKIHANQLNLSGGVETGVSLGALTVDHLEMMDEQAIAVLANSRTIGTLLPSAAFFLRMPFPPARDMIRSDCAIALASDFNPGSSPSGNMNLVVSMACIRMKMLPEEAFNAATINGAFAMKIETESGSIASGKRADLIITRPIPSLAYFPYSFGNPPIDRVMIAGEWV